MLPPVQEELVQKRLNDSKLFWKVCLNLAKLLKTAPQPKQFVKRLNQTQNIYEAHKEMKLGAGPEINPSVPNAENAPTWLLSKYSWGSLLVNCFPLWQLTPHYLLCTTIGHDWQLLLCLPLNSTIRGREETPSMGSPEITIIMLKSS